MAGLPARESETKRIGRHWMRAAGQQPAEGQNAVRTLSRESKINFFNFCFHTRRSVLRTGRAVGLTVPSQFVPKNYTPPTGQLTPLGWYGHSGWCSSPY